MQNGFCGSFAYAGAGASYESREMARGSSWLGPGSLGGHVRTLGWKRESVAASHGTLWPAQGHGPEGGESSIEVPVTKKMRPGWCVALRAGGSSAFCSPEPASFARKSDEILFFHN